MFMKVMGWSQICDSNSEARQSAAMLLTPDFNWKFVNNKLHLFFSVNPKMALIGPDRREYK
jgi:hypothetical protein